MTSTGRLELQPPPRHEPVEGAGGVLVNAIPVVGSLGSIVLVATTGGNANDGRQYVAAGMFLVATLGFIVVQLDRQRAQRVQQVTRSRTEYLRYLTKVRAHVREAAEQQRRMLTWRHPDPGSLPAVAAEGSRVWEIDATDPRFLHLRYGMSHQPLSLELVAPEAIPTDRADPVAASALHRLVEVHRVQRDLPAVLDLRACDRVEVCGAEEPVRSLARAMICSASTFHSPDDLVVAVLASEEHLAQWDWVKWLPHARSPQQSDAVGPRRLVSSSRDELAALLPPAGPHVLLVTDTASQLPDDHLGAPDGADGMTVLDLPARWGELEDVTRLRLQLDSEEALEDGRQMVSKLCLLEDVARATADTCSLPTAEALARRLARVHGLTGAREQASSGADGTDVAALLSASDVRTFDPESAWRRRAERDRLKVPIGTGDDGTVVELDLKEAAQSGMGPHGLVVGATGSGKSELLRTLVLGLAMTHSPEQLNMVLVDFKGGATFAGMAELPHVSALITNLADETSLVDRMQDALSGELVRRQELLREAGSFASVVDYERARAGGGPDAVHLAPLPSLLIVVDEFSEMLAVKPEFIELFVAIGRLGRSLGLHLLLASQRLEEGRLRGLESHLSYRIGLRTFSAQESRSVLGVSDAYELPAVPGLAYLKPDPTTLVRFKAAFVSGPPSDRGHVRRQPLSQPQEILPFTVSPVYRPPVPAAAAAPAREAPPAEPDSVLDIAVRRMAGHGPAAHQVWLPPLDVPDTLGDLMPDLAIEPMLGLCSAHWRARGGLVVPLGTVDRPRAQRRDSLSLDLSGSAGHVAVVGGPRSGKSTVLRTIMASISLVSTPLESQLYVLDLGGGTLAGMADLPHVAGIATRSEPDVVRRIVAEVRGIVDRRETYFRAHGIDSIETYRARRAEGRADDGHGDVFLVVDLWSTLRSDFDDLEPELQQLATRGLTFGVHVVTATGRWADFRAATRDLFGTRLELRLGDPLDSEMDRRVAALVPQGRPGRGLLASKLHFLGALPRIDGKASAATLADGVDDLVARVREAWTGPGGPKLRLLPERVTLAEVLERAGVPAMVPDGEKGAHPLLIGIDEEDLGPASLDPDVEPHLLVLGDSRSGKSAALRAYAHEVMRTRTPKQAQLVVVDYRRSLLGEVPQEYLLGYLTSDAQAQPALHDLAAYLQKRLPGPDVTPGQLRSRSWWTGAEVFVLVDDYDLVTTQHSSPVAVLAPMLAHARDVGLRVVVARRSGGASRALYEPVIQGLRDLAMPGLMLSGSPEEGPLLGNVRPAAAVPGRARLVTRGRGVEVVQLAWTEPVG